MIFESAVSPRSLRCTSWFNVNYLLWVEILRPVCVFFKELARSMSQKLMVGDLKLKGPAVPSIVQIDIIGMNECKLLVCGASVSAVCAQHLGTY
jgi:hypothetical protein